MFESAEQRAEANRMANRGKAQVYGLLGDDLVEHLAVWMIYRLDGGHFVRDEERQDYILGHDRGLEFLSLARELADMVTLGYVVLAGRGLLDVEHPYQHECGHIEWFSADLLAEVRGGCDACESGSDRIEDWRPLYLVARPDELAKARRGRYGWS